MNYNNVYVDRGVDYDNTKTPNPYCHVAHHINGIIDWDFIEVEPGSNTYYISFYNEENQDYQGKRYLQMKQNGKNKTNRLEFPESGFVGNSNRFCQWKIITKKDLKDAFKDTYASGEAPADATFLLYDQNFERGNIYVGKWVSKRWTDLEV